MAESVFLNVPYDKGFEKLYLAYIVGLATLGLTPRPALSIPNDRARFQKIVQLIEDCSYSLHDLSRVQVSSQNGLPRFNMPLELGLALYRSHRFPKRHRAYIFEGEDYRIQESTSDLNAFDTLIHNGTVKGVMTQLRNVFVRESEGCTVPEMMLALNIFSKRLTEIKRSAGTKSLFGGAAITNEIILAANIAGLEVRSGSKRLSSGR